jgi:hypothetical protein
METHSRAAVVRFQPEHGKHIVANMRELDRKEIYYQSLLDAETAVRITLANSVAAWTGLWDGEPAVIWGVARRSKLGRVGVPWLLGTDAMDNAPLKIARQSRAYVERFASVFPRMENHVLAENRRAVVWLRWLGFDMEEAKPFGPFGAPFIRFTKGLT